MMLKASAPASPNRVNMVCLNECITKSGGHFQSRAHVVVLMIEG
jgi:hypothetical protein